MCPCDTVEFSNTNFTREQPDLLCLIKRQKARTEASSSETALDLPSIISDLVAIRKHQTALSSDIKNLQTSNSTLWQEAIQSRDKQAKLQETVTKILRFLATVFGGQVVGQEDESPRENVVVEEEQQGDKGPDHMGKGKEVPLPPSAKRPRLLLEDVKGRDSAGRANYDGQGQELFDLDDEDIEEIRRPMDDPLGHLPQVSNREYTSPVGVAGGFAGTKIVCRLAASQYAGHPSLSRSNSTSNPFGYPSPSAGDTSNSRFTTLPSTTPTPAASGSSESANAETQYHLPPDYLASLLSGGNSPATLEALFQLQNGGGLAGTTASTSAGAIPAYAPSSLDPTLPSTMNTNDYLGRALLPSPKPLSAQPPPFGAGLPSVNPLEGLISPSTLANVFPTSDTVGANYVQQLDDQTSQLRDMMGEKADIDQRTTVLESAIARLMQGLPQETRDQFAGPSAGVDATGPPMSPGLFGGVGADGGIGGWDPNQSLSDADLEKFLAQYGAPITVFLSGKSYADSLSLSFSFCESVNAPAVTPGEDHYSNPFEPNSALGFDPSDSGSGLFEQLNSPSDSFRADSFSNSDGRSSTGASTPGVHDGDDDGDYEMATTAEKGRKRKSAAMEGEEAPSPAVSEGTRRSARKKRW